MTCKSRRTALKGLALTLPAAWAAPVVKSVVLPAHAQTSGCYAPEGCYLFSSQGGGSFSWPGGMGPATVPIWNVPGCPNVTPNDFVDLAIATSRREAAVLLGCGQNGLPFSLPTNAPLPEGCEFYYCQTAN